MNQKYDILLEKVRGILDSYRYSHTEYVYKECIKLSSLFALDSKSRDTLLSAAILHDVTKYLKADGQIELAKKLGVTFSDDELSAPGTMHALTAPAYISSYMPEYASNEVCKVIRYHTTGRENMTVNEKLLFLADYIEESRKFDDCIKVREYFYEMINKKTAPERALDLALVLSFDLTIENLISESMPIHPDTVAARNYLIKNLNNR